MTDRMIELRRRQRTDRCEIEINEVPVTCWYYIDGDYYPANEYDPPEAPSVVLVRAEIGGVDVTCWDELLGITEAILFSLTEGVEP